MIIFNSYPHSDAHFQIFSFQNVLLFTKSSGDSDIKPAVSQWKAIWRWIYCRRFFMSSNQTSHYIRKCIRMPNNCLVYNASHSNLAWEIKLKSSCLKLYCRHVLHFWCTHVEVNHLPPTTSGFVKQCMTNILPLAQLKDQTHGLVNESNFFAHLSR